MKEVTPEEAKRLLEKRVEGSAEKHRPVTKEEAKRIIKEGQSEQK